MVGMSSFDENQHPRGAAGQWVTKANTAPTALLADDADLSTDEASEDVTDLVDATLSELEAAGLDTADLEGSVDSGDPHEMVEAIKRARARLDPQFRFRADTARDSTLETALWSSTDLASNSEPLDANHGVEDISADTTRALTEDVEAFIAGNYDTLQRVTQDGSYDWGNVGHDFWLTRNGHGAGFWDRALGDDGDTLTEAAQTYGGVDLYRGDDGLIHS